MILLDTNVVSEPLRAQPDPGVVTWLDRQAAETLYLSTISLSELLLGIENLPSGRRRNALAGALEEQLAGLFANRILAFDVSAARTYSQLVIRVRRAGYSMSIADAQIAAIAMSHRFSVATRDETSFHRAGLTVINPWDQT